jgi:hypothetical protein
MVAAVLHNFAVVIYCHLTDHNDRIINGEDPEKDKELLESID